MVTKLPHRRRAGQTVRGPGLDFLESPQSDLGELRPSLAVLRPLFLRLLVCAGKRCRCGCESGYWSETSAHLHFGSVAGWVSSDVTLSATPGHGNRSRSAYRWVQLRLDGRHSVSPPWGSTDTPFSHPTTPLSCPEAFPTQDTERPPCRAGSGKALSSKLPDHLCGSHDTAIGKRHQASLC